ncbi:MAG: DinB family protein [Longimicrobiales bacterium]
MSATVLPRPRGDEYGAYYHRYVALVPDGPVLTTLEEQFEATEALLGGLSTEQEVHRYAPDKWSVREVVGHMIDTERLFAYRALSMARADATPLPGMDQEVWAAHSGAHGRTVADLLEEWRAVRRSTLRFFASLDEAAASRTGTASGNPFTVRSFVWIIAGHERWHVGLLRRDYGLEGA